MILIDTSAIFALLDKNDQAHGEAKALFGRAFESGQQFFIHNYLITEATALIQARLGFRAAAEFVKNADKFEIIWITPEIHDMAREHWFNRARRQLSFVDCVSFKVMEQEGIDTALTLDDDFKKAGFKVYK